MRKRKLDCPTMFSLLEQIARLHAAGKLDDAHAHARPDASFKMLGFGALSSHKFASNWQGQIVIASARRLLRYDRSI